MVREGKSAVVTVCRDAACALPVEAHPGSARAYTVPELPLRQVAEHMQGVVPARPKLAKDASVEQARVREAPQKKPIRQGGTPAQVIQKDCGSAPTDLTIEGLFCR